MLKDEKLRIEIIQLHYNIPVAGYNERWKMTELVTRNYWWPGITQNIKKYVDGYNMYQRIKNKTEAPAGNFMANEVPE